jgi:hypothetical protein
MIKTNSLILYIASVYFGGSGLIDYLMVNFVLALIYSVVFATLANFKFITAGEETY